MPPRAMAAADLTWSFWFWNRLWIVEIISLTPLRSLKMPISPMQRVAVTRASSLVFDWPMIEKSFWMYWPKVFCVMIIAAILAEVRVWRELCWMSWSTTVFWTMPWPQAMRNKSWRWSTTTWPWIWAAPANSTEAWRAWAFSGRALLSPMILPAHCIAKDDRWMSLWLINFVTSD